MSAATSSTHLQDTLIRSGIDRSLRHPVMFFLMSGAAWLACALLLGLIASVKTGSPGFLGSCEFLTYGRVQPAHINALVYGWGMQTAFAVILWLMARLTRKECTMAGTILTAGHVWNIGVGLGVIGILAGFGTGMPWMEFPPFAWPVLLASYFAILIGTFIQFRVRPEGSVNIAQWYLLGAVIWFPWIYLTANILLHCVPGHPLMGAAINAWFRSALVLLFFTPVALGAASYLAPKVTGNPLYSDSLSKLGFWSLAIIGPWAGMQKLAGAPIPYFLPYVGGAATALFFIPACAAAVNTIRTVWPCREVLAVSPSLRFTLAGMAVLVLLAVGVVVLYLPDSTLPATQFSLSGYGFEILALYGFFGFVMFGATYFIVPRVTCREWISRRLIRWHFLFSVYGVLIIVFVTLIGGYQQGLGQESWKLPWMNAADAGISIMTAITFAWCLILFSNVFFFLHLTLMWLCLGRRGSQPTLLVCSPQNAGPLDAAHATAPS